MESLKFTLELRKRKESSYLEFTSNDLRENPNKILTIMKREFIDLKSWFLIIMYFYNIKDYENFKRFSDELAKTDIDNNPYYRDQKQIFKYILNVFAFYFINLAQKSKDKDKYEEISTSYFNQAEKISMFDPMTMVCKGFIYFAQGNYAQAETYFSNISESDKTNSVNKTIIILAKIGKGLNFYNKGYFEKAAEHFISLIKDYDYFQENVLECLGICYYNMNKIKKALAIFNKTIELNPKNYKVLVYLAILKLKNIDYDSQAFERSFQLIKKAYFEKEENEFDYIFITFVDILLIVGKIKEAEEIVEKLNKIVEYGDMRSSSREIFNPNNGLQRETDEIKSEVYCLNGNIHHYKNNISEAYSWYRKAIQYNQNNLKAHYGLGQTCLILENHNEAEKYFEPEKYNIDKDNLLCTNKYLAFIYARTKKREYEKILETFQNALNFDDQDIDCYIELAILNELRKPEETLKNYEKAIELIRKIDFDKYNFNKTKNLYDVKDIFPEILNNYATIKLRLNQTDNVDKILNEALAMIKKRLDYLNPKKHQNNLNTEFVHEEVTRFRALELCIFFNIALYHESRSEFGQAYTLYKMILERNSYFIEADIKLGELAKRRGDKEKALEYMKSAIDKHFYKVKDPNAAGTSENVIEQTTSINHPNFIGHSQNNITNPNAIFKNNTLNNSSNNLTRLFPFMSKPVDIMLMKAQIQYERGLDDETKAILAEAYKMKEGKDPYVLIFLGNFNYEMAVNSRKNKENDYKLYMRESLYYYVSALELDKYNAYAAIGIANIFSEYSLTNHSLDIYKSIHEKLPTNTNSYVNEALILLNDKKYEKAAIIMNKLLKKFYHGKNPKIENILAKIFIEQGEYDKAINILKNLMLRYPDDLFFRYNYAFCLYSKSADIIERKDKRVYQTEEAIRNLERAIQIFEAIIKIKKTRVITFKNELDEKFIEVSDFSYKCKFMLESSKTQKLSSENTLEFDKMKEAEILRKINENNLRLMKMLQEQKEIDEKEKERIREDMEKNDLIASSYREQAKVIYNTKENKEKEKPTKKNKQIEDNNQAYGIDELKLNEDDLNANNNENDEEESHREHKHKKDKKHKKHKHKKKKNNDNYYEENIDYFDREFFDSEEEKHPKKKKKLKKRYRDFNLDELKEEENFSAKASNIDNNENEEENINPNNYSIKEDNEINQFDDLSLKYEEQGNEENNINIDQNLVEEDVDYEDT